MYLKYSLVLLILLQGAERSWGGGGQQERNCQETGKRKDAFYRASSPYYHFRAGRAPGHI